jgi:hypothetical protein
MNKTTYSTYRGLAMALFIMLASITSAQQTGICTITNVTGKGFDLNWTAIKGANNYNVEMKLNGKPYFKGNFTTNSAYIKYVATNSYDEFHVNVQSDCSCENWIRTFSGYLGCGPGGGTNIVYIWPVDIYDHGVLGSLISACSAYSSIANNNVDCSNSELFLTSQYINGVRTELAIAKSTANQVYKTNTTVPVVKPEYNDQDMATSQQVRVNYIPDFGWESIQLLAYTGATNPSYQSGVRVHSSTCNLILQNNAYQHKLLDPSLSIYQQDLDESDALQIAFDHIIYPSDCGIPLEKFDFVEADCYTDYVDEVAMNGGGNQGGRLANPNKNVKVLGDPSSGELNYLIHGMEAGTVTVTLYDLANRPLQSTKYNNEKGEDMKLTMAHTLENGVYIISASDGSTQVSAGFKIVKE